MQYKINKKLSEIMANFNPLHTFSGYHIPFTTHKLLKQ